MSAQTPQDQAELLEQGDLILRQLAEEAAAARAEAKKMELKRLMDQARQGNCAELETWLDQNQNLRVDLAETDRPSESIAQGANGANRASVSNGWGSWEVIRAKSRIRVVQRSAALKKAKGGEFAEPLVIGTKADPKSRVSAKLVNQRPTIARPEPLDLEKKAELSRLAANFGSEEEKERRAAKKRVLLFSGLRGAGASAVAHVVLIVVLALVTLKLPTGPAGMSFEASASTVEETVELTQPIETESPDVSEPTSEPETNASFDFSDTISAAAPDSLGNLGPVGDALNSSSMSKAMQASAVTPNAMSSASFFGAAAGGNCFCYVIDGSGSMRGGAWEAARFELFKSLNSLKPKQRFYIIFFGRDFNAISMPGERDPAPRALYATPENVAHAQKWVNGLDFVDGGPPIDAIKFAIEKEPDAIYLLTDGITGVKTVAKQIRDANLIDDLINGEQVRSPIHAIAFYSLKGEQLMRQIAQENKGQFIYVPDPRKR